MRLGKGEIVVDTREPKIVVVEFAKYFRVRRIALEYGDVMGKYYLIERKAIGDLLHSTFDERIYQQLMGLATYAEERDLVAVLAIHGLPVDIAQYTKAVDLLPGIAASAVVRYGVHLVWMPTLEMLVEVLAKMERKAREGKFLKPRRPRKYMRTRLSREASVLATLLRIPQRTAEEIMLKGGLRFLYEASDEELMKVTGIGVKTLERIKTLLGIRGRGEG